jgi:hypothetical protein
LSYEIDSKLWERASRLVKVDQTTPNEFSDFGNDGVSVAFELSQLFGNPIIQPASDGSTIQG